MKKLSIISMAALLLLAASCKKEKTTEQGGDAVFRATTETHSGDSKTQLDDQKAVIWNSGDAIKVFNASGTPCEFTAVSGGLSTTSFGGTAPDHFFDSPSYTAFYPSSEDVKLEDDNYKITLPATQTYAASSFGPGANPMAAVSETTELSFKNICGLLKLQLYSEEERAVQSITLTSTGENLWGTGTVDLTNPSVPALGTLDGGITLTLDCSGYNDGQGVTLGTSESSPTIFYFVVPANTLSSGFTVKVTDGSTYDWTKTAPPQSSAVVRSKILTMPLQTVKPVTPSEVQLTNSYDGVNFTASGSFTLPEGSHKCEYGFVYSAASSSKDSGGTKIIVHSFSDAPISGGPVSFENTSLDVINDGKLYDVSAYAIVDGEMRSEAVQMGPRPCPWSDGTSPEAFSISGTDKVFFSQGNLQYNPNQQKWRFAEHQFDVLHKENADVSSEYTATYDGWIELFGWGTSGYSYQPWSSTDYDPSKSDLSGNMDWGYNPIINGGNKENSGWYTLSGGTNKEWQYLLNSRSTTVTHDNVSTADARYAKIKVGEYIGMLIFPDSFEWTEAMGSYPTTNTWNNASSYTYTQFAAMDAAGAVFLPCAGSRSGEVVSFSNVRDGHYWTRTDQNDVSALSLAFNTSVNANSGSLKKTGYSVRLVKSAN